jgi:Rax2 C-terminal beta propeller domain
MKYNVLIKEMMTLLMAFAMTMSMMASSSPVRAASQTSGATNNATAPIQPLVAGDELWSNKFMLGTDNSVFVIAVAPNGDIYIGGSFTHVAGISANRVAKWTASTNHWSALGSGVNNYVSALALSDNFLYVGGVFSSAGGNPANAVASYDLSSGTWSDMNGGMTSSITPIVHTLVSDGSGNVYASGSFDTAGGVAAQNIAMWNGSAWSALGGGLGISGNLVYALAVSGTDVYAGGDFMSPSFRLAHWTGSTWMPVGSTDGTVYALALSGSILYAGGIFTSVTGSNGTISAGYIASIDLTNLAWSDMGGGMDAQVNGLIADSGGGVYATGNFTSAGGNTAHRVARWNGSSWSSLLHPGSINDGVTDVGYGLATSGEDVYVGGQFTVAGGYPANYLARWNTSDQQWYSPGNTVNGTIHALASSGSDVYVGGDFTSAGGLAAISIARWNSATNTWYQVSSGQLAACGHANCFNPVVNAIAINGPDVYVGGDFMIAGSVNANYVARLNGGTWYAMDGGVSGCNGMACSPVVYSLAADGSGVDVGGDYNNAGLTTVYNIAYWDGSAWHAFTDSGNTNTGTNGPVYAIATDGLGGYYFGGSFTVPRTNIVYFDGFDWLAGWSAPNGEVYSILLSGSDVYIGGSFTNAAGSGADHIAVSRTGSDWQPLGSSLNDLVLSMSQRGNTIYVGGSFTQSGGLGLNHISAWDTVSQTWSNLGSGTDGSVNALATDQVFLYAGGNFSTAGGKVSLDFGRYGQYKNVLLPTVMR